MLKQREKTHRTPIHILNDNTIISFADLGGQSVYQAKECMSGVDAIFYALSNILT